LVIQGWFGSVAVDFAAFAEEGHEEAQEEFEA
jgi:hypothetical protein